MIRMLGRLMWVAVGAIGLKAWEASEQQRQGGGSSGGSRGGNGGGNSGGNRGGSSGGNRSRGGRSTGGSNND